MKPDSFINLGLRPVPGAYKQLDFLEQIFYNRLDKGRPQAEGDFA
jgi:hypothetical protein